MLSSSNTEIVKESGLVADLNAGVVTPAVFVPVEIKAILNEKNYDLVLFDPKINNHLTKYLPMMTKLHDINFCNIDNTLFQGLSIDDPLMTEDNSASPFFWSKPLEHCYTFIALNPLDEVVAYAKISLHRNVPTSSLQPVTFAALNNEFKITEAYINYLYLHFIAVSKMERESGLGSVLLAALQTISNALHADPNYNLSHMFLYAVYSARNFYTKYGDYSANEEGHWNMGLTLPVDKVKITTRLNKFISAIHLDHESLSWLNELETIDIHTLYQLINSEPSLEFLDNIANEYTETPVNPPAQLHPVTDSFFADTNDILFASEFVNAYGADNIGEEIAFQPDELVIYPPSAQSESFTRDNEDDDLPKALPTEENTEPLSESTENDEQPKSSTAKTKRKHAASPTHLFYHNDTILNEVYTEKESFNKKQKPDGSFLSNA